MSEKDRRRALAAKRAAALALMLLTRREDLLVEEVQDDIGPDYIVRFRKASRPGVREFGVAVASALGPAAKEDADAELRPALQRLRRHWPSLRPLCLFFFTMADDCAWYSWAAEPAEAEDGRPALCWREAPDSRPLDRKALNEILARVDRWYRAVLPVLVVNGAGRSEPEQLKIP
jgi:hypothetical protein